MREELGHPISEGIADIGWRPVELLMSVQDLSLFLLLAWYNLSA